MMPHVRFRTIEKPLELKPIRIAIGYYIANLAYNRRKYEDSNEIAHYREYVSANHKKHFFPISRDLRLDTQTSGPRRSLLSAILILFCQISFSYFHARFLSPYVQTKMLRTIFSENY